jgi:hypothetical protein
LGKMVLDRHSIWTVVAFVAVGLSLWIRFQFHTVRYPVSASVAQMSSWLFGMAVLLASQSRFSSPEAESNLSERTTRGPWDTPDGCRLDAAGRA